MKKSFILYADYLETIKDLPDDVAGKVFKLILDYANGIETEVDDILIKTAFTPIKNSLKRDLEHWKSVVEKRKKAGKASANKRQQMSTHVNTSQQMSTDSVSVNDSDSVSDTDSGSVTKKKTFIPPTLDEVKEYFKSNGYQEQCAIRYFNGYDVSNWIDSKGNKIKNWKQKAQHVWFKPEHKEKPTEPEYYKPRFGNNGTGN